MSKTKAKPKVWEGRHYLLTFAHAAGPEPRAHGVRDFVDEIQDAAQATGWTMAAFATVDPERDKNEDPEIEKIAGRIDDLMEQLRRVQFELRFNSDADCCLTLTDIADELHELKDPLYRIQDRHDEEDEARDAA